jgi:SP family sugar:H+ symporter-like MFS transporter
VTFSIPYLLNAPYAGLGSKVGFIFGALAALAMVFTWFCVPEGKDRSLEEIDRMFNEGRSVRNFASWQGGEGAERVGGVSKQKELRVVPVDEGPGL